MATQIGAVTGKRPRSNILDIIRAQAPLVTQDKILGKQIGLQQEQQELEEEKFGLEKERFDLQRAQQDENIAAQKRLENLQAMQGEEAAEQAKIATGLQAAGTALDVVSTIDKLGGVGEVASDIGSGVTKAISSIGTFFKSFF